MFSKIFHKQSPDSQHDLEKNVTLIENPSLIVHYGIPSTASHLAYDPIQQLLAVATQDGRIKIIGGDDIEGLLTSPKQLPYKNLEFLQNQGFLISISHENEVQVWDLEHRCIASTLQWKTNITSFSVVQENSFMYIGDECGLVSVLKYDVEERRLLQLPYCITPHSVSENSGVLLPKHQSVVGILPQPCSRGNRLLFAYDTGIFVLWDVSKDWLILIRGYDGGPVDDSANAWSNEQKNQMSGYDQEDKEITSLCWASLDGSILAVGYVDGDIMLWNFPRDVATEYQKSGKPVNNMVKLQLSEANSRFPVIFLQWSVSGVQKDSGGLLFIYGGDEIGSAEVLTILSLEWSPRREALKSVRRENITLQGSFTDMILLQSYSVLKNEEAPSLFILSSPGQLQFYDCSCLPRLFSHQDKTCVIPIHYSSVVPTTEPYLTAGKLVQVHGNTKCAIAISEMASALEHQGTHVSNEKSSKWPLNGGVPCQMPPLEERHIERLYIAGYQDGSVRIWDATYPTMLPLRILDSEVRGVTVGDTTSSVSALDFSSKTLSIAIGSDSGMVRLCHLSGRCSENRLHVVTGTKSEVCDMDQGNGLSAVFILSASPVCTLRYTDLGTKLAIGYESGQVALVNINSTSVLLLLEALPGSSSAVVSFAPVVFSDTTGSTTSLDQSEPQGLSERAGELIFFLRRDSHIDVLDGSNGNVVSSLPVNRNKESTAISIFILDGTKSVTEVAGENCLKFLYLQDREKVEPAQLSGHYEGGSELVTRSTNFVKSSEDLNVLVCCTDELRLYSMELVMQEHLEAVCKVNLVKTCCWTATFKKNEKDFALIVLYQTGSIELRALPNLEVFAELSLMSVLRWNFKANMDKSTSASESGQIALVNGCEFAIVSLLGHENEFRLPQSLPSLHDNLLAAALDMNTSSDQSKNKEPPFGVFGKIMGDSRASGEAQSMDPAGTSIASKIADDVVKLDIDDIDIDEPLHISPIVHKSENESKDKKKERKKLFEGTTSETKPRQRTVEEIKAKYRKDNSEASSAAAAASQAKDKLLERQEKLEKLSKNTEELRDGAENFASMAKELAKRMENRKWWQL